MYQNSEFITEKLLILKWNRTKVNQSSILGTKKTKQTSGQQKLDFQI